MPSPPRRATRSAVPVAGAAPAPSSRTQKTASLSASSSSSSSSVTGKLPRSAPKSKSSSPVVTQNEHAQDDSLLDAGSRRSQRTRKASEADTLGVLAAEDEPNPDQNVAQDDSEDVTRCLCGGSLYTDDGDDPMYIQCDTCLVWQHGGCVGIYDDSQAPETYFCELCRPDLHRLSVRSNGQPYSLFQSTPHESQPPSSRKTSLSAKNESANKEREQPSRLSLDSASARGRPTMNSSRTDYDEEEAFRKAIEQSKAENATKPAGSRKGKRSRADSDVTIDNKRQRTGSGSEDATSHNTASLNAYSDTEQGSTRSHQKKAKPTVSDTQRNKDMRDRELVKEQQRQDAASRRKDRAGRRRVDDADAAEETTLETATAEKHSPPAIDVATPPSPPAAKKSHGKKPKRSGRNQYSAPLEKGTVSPPTKATGQSNSSGDDGHAADDVAGEEAVPVPTSHHKGKGKWKGKPVKGSASSSANDSDGSKDKKLERTLQDMETATQWMLSFIAKTTQANESPAIRPADSNAADGVTSTPKPMVDTDFGQMSSADMAERLKNQIVSWQTEFAHGGQGLEVAA